MWKKNVWISALYVGDDGRYQCDYNFATTICNFDHGLRSDQKVTLLLRDDHVLFWIFYYKYFIDVQFMFPTVKL